MSSRFGLAMRLEVFPLAEQAEGSGVWRRDYNQQHTGLKIDDELDLGVAGFMEIAVVLGRFHELAEAIAQQKAELPAVPAVPPGTAALGELPDLRGFVVDVAEKGLTCGDEQCPAGGDLEVPWRRLTVGELLQRVARHRRSCHTPDVVNLASL